MSKALLSISSTLIPNPRPQVESLFDDPNLQNSIALRYLTWESNPWSTPSSFTFSSCFSSRFSWTYEAIRMSKTLLFISTTLIPNPRSQVESLFDDPNLQNLSDYAIWLENPTLEAHLQASPLRHVFLQDSFGRTKHRLWKIHFKMLS